ncbi:helix-turn-helix transcriptional regulator [Nonomuraea sediminis]|uniref:helix-turn-helix transcriptional regulator n=1 Tax=Nonomuraea sediminis TaxID=2835864 RepID=UPI001BDDB9B3|nr:helix-turn-helix transcriptional regulator [Nonomuraea sediminis]
MAVVDATCWNDHRRFNRPTPGPDHAIHLQRTGGFAFRIDGKDCFVDATVGLVLRMDEERQVAHPVKTHDTATIIRVPEEVASSLTQGAFTIFAPMDHAHRSMLAACRRGIDEFELTDRLYSLVRLIPDAHSASHHRLTTDLQHRRIVAQAAAALAEEDGLRLGLDALGRLLGYSPHHLSRVFRRVTGMTLTAYRNEVRVRAVLEDLHQGERSLRTLAVKYGFADQAHLTRVMRRHRQATPSALLESLAPKFA